MSDQCSHVAVRFTDVMHSSRIPLLALLQWFGRFGRAGVCSVPAGLSASPANAQKTSHVLMPWLKTRSQIFCLAARVAKKQSFFDLVKSLQHLFWCFVTNDVWFAQTQHDDIVNRIEALEGIHGMIAPRVRALETRGSQFDARLSASETQKKQ